MPDAFSELLVRRADAAGIQVPPRLVESLSQYFAMLARWNARMNLTALPTADPTPETIDRLFIEPLAAARFIPGRRARWIDVGSGGGSPAIPIKLVHPALQLTMVEAKARKATFLRELVRKLGLDAEVECARVEHLPPARLGSAELATVRAVKVDTEFVSALRRLIAPRGRLLLFQSRPDVAELDNFGAGEAQPLIPSAPHTSYLIRYRG